MSDKYYTAKMCWDGTFYFIEWTVFRETPSMLIAVQTDAKWIVDKLVESGSKWRSVNLIGIKKLMIHKGCSRKAFSSKQQAHDHMIMLKKKQIEHMQNEIELISEFVKNRSGRAYDCVDDEPCNSHLMYDL